MQDGVGNVWPVRDCLDEVRALLAEFKVRGPESLTPFADAVGFVYDQVRDLDPGKAVKYTLLPRRLRIGENHPDLAVSNRLPDPLSFVLGPSSAENDGREVGAFSPAVLSPTSSTLLMTRLW
jgi:hypothetical protein